jgi:site-specific recombinase XerD
MSGRIEKENNAKDKMLKRLAGLPEVISDFYYWMDARDKTYTTMRNYINHVVEFMTFFTKGKKDNHFYKKVRDVDIERYITSLRTKNINGVDVNIGDDIRAAKWSSLNTFFKFLAQKRYIDNNPMLLTERPRIRTSHEITYMDQKEVESVFERISSEATKKYKNRDMCIVALGLGTGLRVSAIVNINVEDINFVANTIKVVEKGRKTKEVKFAEKLKNLILVWLKDRELYYNGDETGPLFYSSRLQRISVDSVEHLVKKYTDHLPKKITPHKLRSSAAMNLYGAGVDILTIASILGHENVTTTQRYTKAYDENKTKAANILDSML